MIKKLLICMLMFSSISVYAMEAEKKMQESLTLEKMPLEIKDLIARALVEHIASETEAREICLTLRKLSHVNREFRIVINGESFTKFVINIFRNKLNEHPMSAAALLATPQAEKWLREQNPDIELLNHLLYDKTVRNDYLGVKFLLKVGANLNGRYSLALSEATLCNDCNLVKLLLTKDPDQQTKNEALFCILLLGSKKNEEQIKNIVQILIDAGADIKAQESHGLSPLKIAKDRNLNDIAKTLEELMQK